MPTVARFDQLPTLCPVAGIPLLFPDTCALLDIVRLPIRQDPSTIRRELSAASQIAHAALESPPRLIVVVAPPIDQEWAKNLPNVIGELNIAIERCINQSERFIEAQNCFSIPPIGAPLRNTLNALVTSSQALASSILDCAVHLSEDEAAMARAVRRVANYRAPATKGGEVKDCMIVEHVLAGISAFTASTKPTAAVFLTSNTTDYYESSAAVLRVPLNTEFPSAGLRLVTNWKWAATEIGI